MPTTHTYPACILCGTAVTPPFQRSHKSIYPLSCVEESSLGRHMALIQTPMTDLPKQQKPGAHRIANIRSISIRLFSHSALRESIITINVTRSIQLGNFHLERGEAPSRRCVSKPAYSREYTVVTIAATPKTGVLRTSGGEPWVGEGPYCSWKHRLWKVL